MKPHTRLARFFRAAFLFVLLFSLARPAAALPQADGPVPPAPLPADCAELAPVDGSAPQSCIRGYVYFENAPLAGASVTLHSPSGELTLTTAAGPSSGEPYFIADLTAAPLLAAPGDTLSLSAEHGGMTSSRDWTVQSGAQQVDVGLLAGYSPAAMSPTPPAAPAAPAPLAPTQPHTDVGGMINADTTWGLSGSPYIVTGNLLVMEGKRLTIQPGVQVRFNAGRALQINGELVARGSGDQPITFTSNAAAAPGAWGYIYFTDTSADAVFNESGAYLSGSIIQYAVIEYADGSALTPPGVVRLEGAAPYLDHNLMRFNASDAVIAWNSGPGLRVTNNTLTANGVPGAQPTANGVNIQNRASSLVSGNNVTGNTGFGVATSFTNVTISSNKIIGNMGGMIVDNAFITISGNEISGNVGYPGIFIIGGTIDIAGNIISGNRSSAPGGDGYGGGISICGGSCNGLGGGTVTISNNILQDNTTTAKGGGINNSGGGITVSGNFISGNSAPGAGGAIASGGYYGGGMTVSGNIITRNHAGTYGGAVYATSGTVEYNVIAGNSADISTGGVVGATELNHNSLLYNTAPNRAAADICNTSGMNHNTLYHNASTGGGLLGAVSVCGAPSFGHNNFDANTGYALMIDNPVGPTHFDARENWWGSADDAAVQGLIWDWFDDPLKQIVDYAPFLTALDPDDPITPPAGLTLTQAGTDISLSWAANKEPDLAGYRVYWDTDGGYPYAHSQDVGTATRITLFNLPPVGRYVFTVTAYDASRDGVHDQTDGNESWFASEQAADIGLLAGFSASPTSGAAPLEVSFTDTSSGGPTAWSWSFGDGAASDQQNPTHTYTAPGAYTVRLTASGPAGADTLTRAGLIRVGSVPPAAAFSADLTAGPAPLQVSFTDQSAGQIDAWAWTFGDGGTSSLQHPAHTYAAAGLYTVALTVSGPGGSSTATRAGYITAGFPAPGANFSAAPASGSAPLGVSFTDTSSGPVTGWTWAFGDGHTGGARHPANVYAAPGTYSPALTVSGPGGTRTRTRTNLIAVSAPPAAPTWTFMLYFAGDNNVDRALAAAVDRLEKVADHPNLNILVLFDGPLGGDTHLYKLQHNTTPGIGSQEIAVSWNPGELDTGQPSTLASFVTWARAAYPADHSLLAIANHGRGATGIAFDGSSDADYLSSYSDLRAALAAATAGGASKIDVLYLDACLMGMLEVADEARPYADYLVASENLAWSAFIYDRYVQALTPSTTPRQLAVSIADLYHQALPGYPHTVSAVDLGALAPVTGAAHHLGGTLKTHLLGAGVGQIAAARAAVQTFDSRNYGVIDSSDEYVDLYHLAALIKAGIADAPVQAAAQEVMDTLSAAVIAEHHLSAVSPVPPQNNWDLENAHGLSIYFPPANGGWDYANYTAGDRWLFTRDTYWDDFLVTYFYVSILPPETPLSPGIPPMQAPEVKIYVPAARR